MDSWNDEEMAVLFLFHLVARVGSSPEEGASPGRCDRGVASCEAAGCLPSLGDSSRGTWTRLDLEGTSCEGEGDMPPGGTDNDRWAWERKWAGEDIPSSEGPPHYQQGA